MRCVSTILRHPPSSSELGSAHLVVEQENVAVPMLQVRPPELFWNKTTCQKHLNIHTTLPALLLPGTIKKGVQKNHCPSGNTLYDFFLHMIFIQHQDKVLLAEIAIRLVSQRNQCSLSSFQTFISICCDEEVRYENLPISSPAQSPHKLSARAKMRKCQWYFARQACSHKWLLRLGSSNAHPMATGLITSEHLSKGEGEGRINDCLQELFRTHWHSRRKCVRQLSLRKNINISLFIHRLFAHSSNTEVHETEQSVLYLT